MEKETGWKPIPLSLKILFVVFIFWVIGSLVNLPNIYAAGLSFFGVQVNGASASIIVLLLDVLAPLTFLFALWHRKFWATTFAFSYIAIFSLHSVVDIFTSRERLGLVPILIPLVANVIFLIIIYNARNYFNKNTLRYPQI